MNEAFGEIIQSSLTSWVAQVWRWDNFPSFGSLVTIKQDQRSLIGLIYQINTGSAQMGRTPYAYQQTQEELLRTQPHIFDFLITTFDALVMGYYENGIFYYQLAPQPPKIHAFVSTPNPEFYKDFFLNKRYLPMIFSHMLQTPCHDELLLALLKIGIDQKALQAPDIIQCAETFSLLTGNDYKRLKTFLYRVQALL